MRKKSYITCILAISIILVIPAHAAAKQLIVLYPASSSANLSGEVDAITYASRNTVSIAQIILDETGADVFELELVSPYSASYSRVLMEAKDDQKIAARPELVKYIDNMDEYDTIFLGYANWWASIPMPVASFLESYDFSGKRILPFCTHGGGRFGQSISAIAKLIPKAQILEPFEVMYGGNRSLENDIITWLNDNGVLQ